jgi:hypothetical protein
LLHSWLATEHFSPVFGGVEGHSCNPRPPRRFLSLLRTASDATDAELTTMPVIKKKGLNDNMISFFILKEIGS